MSEVVYPLKLPVVSSLPQASVYTNRLVIYADKVYYSNGTDWIELGTSTMSISDIYLYVFIFGGD